MVASVSDIFILFPSLFLIAYDGLAKLCYGIFISSVKRLESNGILRQRAFVDDVKLVTGTFYMHYTSYCFL